MKALILYTKYTDSLRILAVYTNGYRFERRFKFSPLPLEDDLDTVKKFSVSNPIQFGRIVEVELDDFSGKEGVFGENLLKAIELYGDEKVLLSLTTKKGGK